MKAVLVLLLVLAPATWAGAAPPTDAEVDTIAAQLRCVVCQNLSVADSPAEMARQMRDLIRERLAQGETPEEVKTYFVGRYGEWVLLSPPVRGFPLLAWVLPLSALAGGVVGALAVLRRWSRRGVRAGAEGRETDDEIDDETLAAVREEVGRRAE